MPETIGILENAKDGFNELSGTVDEIGKIIKKGDEQADTRKHAIYTIKRMCDALQLASDLVATELSSCIVEFGEIRAGDRHKLDGYFRRVATKFSDNNLRLLLHEGKVCGELHALGDRFAQPFSDVTTGGVNLWQNVKTLFTRSNKMSNAVFSLYEGEYDFIEDFIIFLNEVRDRAENLASSYDDPDIMREGGDMLLDLMRDKRESFEYQLREIRRAAKECVDKLH